MRCSRVGDGRVAVGKENFLGIVSVERNVIGQKRVKGDAQRIEIRAHIGDPPPTLLRTHEVGCANDVSQVAAGIGWPSLHQCQPEIGDFDGAIRVRMMFDGLMSRCTSPAE